MTRRDRVYFNPPGHTHRSQADEKEEIRWRFQHDLLSIYFWSTFHGGAFIDPRNGWLKGKLGRVEATWFVQLTIVNEILGNLLSQYWPTIVFWLSNVDNYAYQVLFFFIAISILTRISLKFFYLLKILIVLCAFAFDRLSLVIRVGIFIEIVIMNYNHWIIYTMMCVEYHYINTDPFPKKFSKNLDVIFEKNIRTNFK